jgi:hypothetical protein
VCFSFDELLIRFQVSTQGGETTVIFFFLGIFLSGFKLNAQDVDRRLNFIDENDGGLPLEIVISLKRFQPNTEEAEMYRNYKGAKEDLPKTDHFMIKVHCVSFSAHVILCDFFPCSQIFFFHSSFVRFLI